MYRMRRRGKNTVPTAMDNSSSVVFAETAADKPRRKPDMATRDVVSGAETRIATLPSQKTVHKLSVRNSTEHKRNSGNSAAMTVLQIATRRG